MEIFYNQIFSERYSDVVSSRRIMSEFYAYCLDHPADDQERVKIQALLDVVLQVLKRKPTMKTTVR
jgi:hypothetical protein